MRLTKRELEVLRLIATGKCTKEIGILLGISTKTAATHRVNLYGKLAVHNTAQLILRAIKLGFIQLPSA